MAGRVEHDTERERFVVRREEGDAHLTYGHVDDDVLDYRHTYVPPELRGEGLGERIVLTALRYARDHGYRIKPTCSYVAKVLDDHPEFAELASGG